MSFAGEYKMLNAAQRLAVDTIDGPLLVVAGPGTGKTQLLGMRVANILQHTDMAPQNILCLTFTNKAAANMQNRLRQLAGQAAEGVYVRTFHSFAAEVMNRYPQHFWSGARLSIAPDAVQLEIIQQVLSGLPGDHPLALKFAGQYTLIRDVQDSINLAKEAGLTPKKLKAIIEANISYIDVIEPAMARLGELRVSQKTTRQMAKIVHDLPDQQIDRLIEPLLSLGTVIKESLGVALDESQQSGKNTAVSQWKRRWVQLVDGAYKMQAERQRNEWWLAVTEAYSKYRQALHVRSYYDYADMLVEVIGQLEQNASLRADLQEQFQYVLIDEFQDTNAAQVRLAHLVADHPQLAGRPNLMAVGDDDQSIFKFQGAELSNMLGFSRSYPKAKIIILDENYRSSQAILDTAAKIIDHASYRLVDKLPNLTKDLKAKSSAAEGKIEHWHYRSRVEQIAGMAGEANKLFKSGSSVAVLARGHASLRDMAIAMTQQNIPIHYEQANDIFENPATAQLILLLRTTTAIKSGNKPLASTLLSQILPHPMWNLDSRRLWNFAISQSTRQDWFSGLLTYKNKGFRDIGNFIAGLVQSSTTEPAIITIETAIGLRPGQGLTSPFRDYYLGQGKLGHQYLDTLSAVQLLRALAAEFSGQARNSINDFVALVELLQENGKVLANTTPFNSSEQAVELLSVHKAKGLEFDAVLVVDATRDQWSANTRGRLPPANLPLRPAQDDADDYARLMYVAATRAKSNYIVSSYQHSIQGDVVPTTVLIDQMPSKDVPASKGQQLIAALEHTLGWPRLSKPDEKSLLKDRLENYSMSVTHLINFLDITRGGPQHFFERNLLRLPDVKSPSAALGSAVHSALQLAQNQINQNKFDLKKILTQFDNTLVLEGLAKQDFVQQISRGHGLLKNLFNKLDFLPALGGRPEYAIKDIVCGPAIINGTLDTINMTGDQLVITDYKTGRPLSSLNARSGEAGLKAWRHRQQLIYYAMLAQLEPHIKNSAAVVCQMLYVEAKTKSDLTRQYSPSADEITRLGTLISVVWQHIQALNFPSTKSYSNDLSGIVQFEDDLIAGKI